MNKILQLKGNLDKRKNKNKPGLPSLRKSSSVLFSHIQELVEQLINLYKYWQTDDLIGGALISVHYNTVVAKTNRIKGIFVLKSSDNTNDTIRGARFEKYNNKTCHIFTHFISLEALDYTIKSYLNVIELLKHYKIYAIDYDKLEELKNDKRIDYKKYNLSLSRFLDLVINCSFVRSFEIDRNYEDNQNVVTLYKTKYSTGEVLEKLDIKVPETMILGGDTVQLTPDQLSVLEKNAPYLIAMQTVDMKNLTPDNYQNMNQDDVISIPKPTNEPIVGVIDTLFYEDVYFKDWVIFENLVDKNLLTGSNQEYDHGTAVTSIIVDGPTINPEFDDHCGRFKVKHFGVCNGGRFSSFSVLRNIRYAVQSNPTIKVWNLSLGSILPIKEFSISPEAAELDRIQTEFDVIFIVSGTNSIDDTHPKIGAPADSINSIVVNSVKTDNSLSSYYRTGPVLSFFHKPDVSYYGGDKDKYMRVCNSTGEKYVQGTSFAAPWITRKVAYLIYKLGFNRETAKALLIDAAAGWDRKDDKSNAIGFGVVPKTIEEIVETSDDEIKFIINGYSELYETFTTNIPIPVVDDKQPFYAKATLCYFPRCSRSQGVDYTNTEMDIHFGRTKIVKGKVTIDSINGNDQDGDSPYGVDEQDARDLYRKWDNVKHINEVLKSKRVPKKVYENGNWGLSIKTKERLTNQREYGLPFAVVVTLKEMKGINRIDEFIKLCTVKGWVVNTVDIMNSMDIYNIAEEDIYLE